MTRNPDARAAGGGEVLALFFELEAQVDGLLFEVGDLLGRSKCPRERGHV
jgi:hypothetical protein